MSYDLVCVDKVIGSISLLNFTLFVSHKMSVWRKNDAVFMLIASAFIVYCNNNKKENIFNKEKKQINKVHTAHLHPTHNNSIK